MPHQGLKILLLAAPTGIVPANPPIVTTSIVEGFSKHTSIGVFLFSEYSRSYKAVQYPGYVFREANRNPKNPISGYKNGNSDLEPNNQRRMTSQFRHGDREPAKSKPSLAYKLSLKLAELGEF
jgi:hypothetical protein